MTGRIPKVVVMGPGYVDIAIKCDQFPGPGEVVEGSGFSCVPTGSGTNMAIEAARCGCETYLIGKVGDDHFGQVLRENLQKNKVNTDFLYKANAINTGIIVGMSDSIGENCGCISTGANRALAPDEIECALAEQLISSSDVCLIDDGVPQRVAVTAIRLASGYSTKVILNAGLSVSESGELIEPDWPMEFYSVNLLIPKLANYTAAESGAGNVHRLKLIGSELIAGGVGCVVISIGQRGTLIIDRQGSEQLPAFELDLADHTGSEDAFAGALAASCGAGDSPKDAAKFASAAEALAASKYGLQESLPSREEIIELLQKQSD
ncbi:MAG: hypothetical protein JW912_00935 [Sedimentisphaerales bacterium]|nr:hypothetical protein [Sedimentisphaerales bacterium]